MLVNLTLETSSESGELIKFLLESRYVFKSPEKENYKFVLLLRKHKKESLTVEKELHNCVHLFSLGRDAQESDYVGVIEFSHYIRFTKEIHFVFVGGTRFQGLHRNGNLKNSNSVN